ncbi:MAG: carboxypeptidase-like regulatory domain-containing protein, partial [Candidatus Levyibacteriota bacterium]
NNPLSNVGIKETATNGDGTANYQGLNIGVGITNATGRDVSYGSNNATVPQTDVSGNTNLWVLPNNPAGGSYTFTATPPSGSSYSTTVLDGQSITETTSKTITLHQPVTLSGHVYDPQGNPVANQVVSLQAAGVNAQSTTDSSGNYQMTVASGTYQLGVVGTNNSLSLNVPQKYTIQVDSYTLTQSKVLDITIPAKKVKYTCSRCSKQSSD